MFEFLDITLIYNHKYTPLLSTYAHTALERIGNYSEARRP